MRNRRRVAAAGALTALAVGVCLLGLSRLQGGDPESGDLRVSMTRQGDRPVERAGGLLRSGSFLAERGFLAVGEGGADQSDPPPEDSTPSGWEEGSREESPMASRQKIPEQGAGEGEGAGQLLPLVVLSAQRTPKRVTGEVLGMDPYAPRALSLWRIAREGGRDAVLAHGESARDGRFRFASALLPNGRVRLAVTRRGVEPRDPSASPAFEIRARALEAPRVTLRAGDGGAWRLDLRWARAGATLLVADEAGRELVRLALPEPGKAAAGGMGSEIEMLGAEIEAEIQRETGAGSHGELGRAGHTARDSAGNMAGDTAGDTAGNTKAEPPTRTLLVAQRLADGRQSAWSPLVLPTPPVTLDFSAPSRRLAPGHEGPRREGSRREEGELQ